MSAAALMDRLGSASPISWQGEIVAVGSLEMVATGPLAAVGDICDVDTHDADGPLEAEVSCVRGSAVTLVPFSPAVGVQPGARVRRVGRLERAPVGDAFAGRLVDAFGRPRDGLGSLVADAHVPIEGKVMTPVERAVDVERFATGLRAVDGLLPLAEGQRVGILAAAGVGKTSLMRQIARQSDVDHCVVCLVGERGREVKSLWEETQEAHFASHPTLVAATSDQTPPARIRAVKQALALCEHWRSQGRSVLLVLDSVTRYAMALREIGLASGSPPTTRAYTPNVFEALPRLVERCGASLGGGVITAIFTVLTESDDADDPISEVMKSLLDGHITLSRTLANGGQFPAIDLEASLSRLGDNVVSSRQRAAMRAVRRAFATYGESKVMIESGLYASGANPDLDRAIALRRAGLAFMAQDEAPADPDIACDQLVALVEDTRA